MKSNEVQLLLGKSKFESRLKDLDSFETEEELREYLEPLNLSEFIDIHYNQESETSRIRKIILDSIKKKD